jgi:hypothetical protein
MREQVEDALVDQTSSYPPPVASNYNILLIQELDAIAKMIGAVEDRDTTEFDRVQKILRETADDVEKEHAKVVAQCG